MAEQEDTERNIIIIRCSIILVSITIKFLPTKAIEKFYLNAKTSNRCDLPCNGHCDLYKYIFISI